MQELKTVACLMVLYQHNQARALPSRVLLVNSPLPLKKQLQILIPVML
ncbi:MAG: hypothetical protein ACP5O3_03650 [Candidatus Micrarchaeia archaeon]